MRITGGRYRGRLIACPPGIIRPSMDRMRESLFSILGNLEGIRFLDLFSGSGVVGIEAASRGATHVVLVEKDHGKAKTIRRNIEIAGDAVRLIVAPVERYILGRRGPFDIVFLDPPFDYRFKVQLLEKLGSGSTVTEGGIVVIHFPQEEELPDIAGTLDGYDMRKFGRSLLRFYVQRVGGASAGAIEAASTIDGGDPTTPAIE